MRLTFAFYCFKDRQNMSVARIFVEIFVQNIVFSLPLSLSNSVCCMAKNAVTVGDAAQWEGLDGEDKITV